MTLNISMIDLGTGGDSGLLPLGSALVGEYAYMGLSAKGISSTFSYYIFWPSQDDLAAIAVSDVVCFATYVWNIKNSLHLAKTIKTLNPNIKIVFGGYSIPRPNNGTEEFFQTWPQVDYLVHGEGEVSFLELLESVACNTKCESIAVSYRSETGVIIATAEQNRTVNLEDVPSPFLNGTFDKLIRKYQKKITGALWETDRGCPFSCTFCDWGDSAVNKIKKYPLDRLKAEIDWIGKNSIDYIFNCNANFGILYERDLEISEAIASTKRRYGYPNFFTTNWTKNSHEKIITIAEKLSSAGIQGDITLSVQSMNQPTLKAIKRVNLPDEKLLALKKLFHDKGVPTYTELILPLPLETCETVKNSLRFLMSFEEHSYFIFYPCSILINTEMANSVDQALFKIKTVANLVPISRRVSASFEVREEDALVVSTSSMTIDEHRSAYTLFNFSLILYNHRTLFYLLKYLKQFGIEPLDFIERLMLFSVQPRGESAVPTIAKIISIINTQFDQILLGNGATNSLPGIAAANFYPHELGFIFLLENLRAFEKDINLYIERVFQSTSESALDLKAAAEILNFNLNLLPSGDWLTKSYAATPRQVAFFEILEGSELEIKQSNMFTTSTEKQQHYQTLLRGGRRIRLNSFRKTDKNNYSNVAGVRLV